MQKQIGFLFIIGLSTNWAIAQNVGIGTTNPRARLHVADSSVLFTAPATLPANAGNTPVSGPGHRMMWYANKAALRLGRTSGNQSDAAQVGLLSFAAGVDNIVTGFVSAAFGVENLVSGGYNFAAGYGNQTRSVTAAAFGFNNMVKAQHGFVAGLHNDTTDIAAPEVAGSTDRLFQIGNGSSFNNRKNAITILRNGNTGIGTVNPAARLHVADSSVLYTAPAILPAEPGNPPVSGAGNRMMWYANKASFRAGGVQSTEWDISNVGSVSFAANYGNRASGTASAAFGSFTIASGPNSFSIGGNTQATGGNSFAGGLQSMARGFGSAVLGFGNLARAPYAFVAGIYNDTSDVTATEANIVATDRIFQIGNGSTATNRTNALTVLRNGNTGIGTVNPAARLHVADSAVLFNNSLTVMPANPSPPPVQGPGVRMMWYPQKAAFRAGAVDNGALNGNPGSSTGSVFWDADSIGRFSAAFGYNNLAVGKSSFAAGEQSSARGYAAIALGLRADALGYGSFASNNGGATGDYSFAANIAYASGNYSFAANNSGASGAYSVAMGDLNAASGSRSVAIGQNNNASAQNAVAIGFFNKATALRAVALGYNNTASGQISTALGNANTASGPSSLVAGFNSVASGGASIAMGEAPRAKALGGFASGSYNDTADAPNPLVSAPSDRIFQIGNGTIGSRSNALTVLRNGNTGIGITDPAYTLDLSNRMRIRGAPGSTAGIWLNNEANTAIPAFIGMFSDNQVGFFGNGGVGWGFLWDTQTGNATLSGSLTTNSDARLKKDIVPLSNSLEALQQLSGYSYHWKDASNPEEQIGLLAQEIQKVYPQLVKENAQGTLSVNYNGMVPVLLEAIKEQQKQSEKQQEELNALKKLVQELLNTKQ